MRKMILTCTTVLCLALLTTLAYAALPQTQTSNINATVGSVFSLEFYIDPNVLYTINVPFSSVDPTNAYNYADGRAENDGKSDVGLLVKTNQGTVWYLKIGIDATSPLLDKLGYYMGQPTNRNTGGPASGTDGHADWFNIPATTAPDTMYTSGVGEGNNTPLGTLATLSYKIDGSGMGPGAYTGAVTYTLTETI